MKIIEDTPDRLVVEDRPILIGLILTVSLVFSVYLIFVGYSEGRMFLLFAMLFFAAGALLAFLTVVKRTRLVLDRTSGRMILRVASSRKTDETREPLKSVNRAVVQETHSTDSRGSRIVLTFEGRKSLPLTNHFSGGTAPEHVVDRINAFLEKPTDQG